MYRRMRGCMRWANTRARPQLSCTLMRRASVLSENISVIGGRTCIYRALRTCLHAIKTRSQSTPLRGVCHAAPHPHFIFMLQYEQRPASLILLIFNDVTVVIRTDLNNTKLSVEDWCSKQTQQELIWILGSFLPHCNNAITHQCC